jgi:hypothetical protein
MKTCPGLSLHKNMESRRLQWKTMAKVKQTHIPSKFKQNMTCECEGFLHPRNHLSKYPVMSCFGRLLRISDAKHQAQWNHVQRIKTWAVHYPWLCGKCETCMRPTPSNLSRSLIVPTLSDVHVVLPRPQSSTISQKFLVPRLLRGYDFSKWSGRNSDPKLQVK